VGAVRADDAGGWREVGTKVAASAPKLVAADIVTGFLGSGKTTLLKAVLRNGLAGRKVALIVNDFAEIGVDGVVLQGMNVDRLVELPNGCVCCTIGSRFALAVQEIVETVQPHLLVIETSGVAEPGPLVSELALAGVRTDAVITTVDAEWIERLCKESVAAIQQVEQADFIVLNKIDLVSPRRLRRVERLVRKLNHRALLLPTTYGQVDAGLLFATGAGASWRGPMAAGGNGSRHPGDGIGSFSFRHPGLMVRSRFEEFLQRLPREVYRAKGVVKFAGEGWYSVFNYTCGRSRIDWLAPAEGDRFDNRAVFLGRDLLKRREDLLRRLEECVERAA